MPIARRPAIVVAAPLPDRPEPEVRRSLDELTQLLAGLGVDVVAELVQRRAPGPAYLGEGKLRELVARAAPLPPEALIVVDDELAPGPQRGLHLALDRPILDRTAVILQVFEARARTRLARLEVELARLAYELPRIRDDPARGDREGGGGRAARGHTNVELAKQRARHRMAEIRRELARLTAAAEHRHAGAGLRVALVGYTNAGKSSLVRQLTGSEVVVEDRLFATLDTAVRALAPPSTPPVLVVDTVGFLHRLPHALVASFRSTLAEAHEAALLLHVVDASDPAWRAQRAVTDQILAELGVDAAATPTWLVLTKADRLDPAARAALAAEVPDAILTSALDPVAGAALRARLDRFVAARLEERTVVVPYPRQGVLAELRPQLQVVREDCGDAITVTVRGLPAVLAALAARLSAPA